jgi:hypothetical protein
MILYASVLCLCILASSRISRYDLGRQILIFQGGLSNSGPHGGGNCVLRADDEILLGGARSGSCGGVHNGGAGHTGSPASSSTDF